MAALRRWGLLDQVVATGCPPVGRYSFDFGPITLAGAPGDADSSYAYAPRRQLLDKILVDAAAAAGVEVREVIGGWPHAELAKHRDDVEGTLLAMFDSAPAFAERVRGAQREERIVGASVPNYFRTVRAWLGAGGVTAGQRARHFGSQTGTPARSGRREAR